MGITFGDHLIDSGYHDITPEQEREIEEARDKDDLCARAYDCPCGGWDCSGRPGGPLYGCPYVAPPPS
jgi:hypothetical protein